MAALKPTVDGLTASQNPAQDTVALGVRWDAYKSLDVKLQYDHVKPAAGSRGFFNNTKAGFTGPVSVYSVAVDFVF